MSIKSDKWIRRMADKHRMIEPFEPRQIKEIGGRQIVSVPLPDAPVVGAHLWAGVRFSSTTAGLILNDTPAVGSSHDLYLENDAFLWFGGSPKANFALRLVDAPSHGLAVSTKRRVSRSSSA